MDFEQARFNMIEQQIRPWEVLDPAVLGALETVRREAFVPEQYQAFAFADMNIPLADGEVMMSPKVEARLIQSLEVRSGDRVLEVGTGSGHMAALLAALGGTVTTVEIKPALAKTAHAALIDQGFDNVTVEEGDAADGWPSKASGASNAAWDAIILTGSIASLDPLWHEQLAPGGRLVAVVGTEPIMEAVLVTRLADNSERTQSLFDTSIPPLSGATASAASAAFVF